jgi:ketosteroid isomerase-like protein
MTSAQLLLAVLVSLASPQGGGTSALLKLEDAWAAAMVRRDGATFHKLLAAGFVYTEDDHVMDRESVLREITTGSDTVTDARNEEMRIHPFGTTAVVTGWLVLRGRGPQGPFDRRYRFTDTWMKRGNQWQIIAAHDYLVPAKGRS